MPVNADDESKRLQIKHDQIKPLNLVQQKQVIDLLSEYAARFSDKPGFVL